MPHEDIYPYMPTENGWHPDPLDTRDISIEEVLGAPQSLPAEYDVINEKLGGVFRVKDQQSSLSCVGQTFAELKQILDSIDLDKSVDLSAVFIYSRIYLARVGGGAFLRDAAQLLIDTGVCEEILNKSNPIDETTARIVNSSQTVLENARKYKAKGFVTVSPNVNVIKQAILNGNGMATSSNITQSGWGGNAVKNNGGFVKMPQPGEAVQGHAYLFTGWSDSRQAFQLLNHWSELWGIKGRAWLRYSDIGWLGNGWTILDIPTGLLDARRNMYNLRRHPSSPNEVFAVSGNVWRHITNFQTLELGNKEPDRYWIVPLNSSGDLDPNLIPVASQDEMATMVEADEILILPKD